MLWLGLLGGDLYKFDPTSGRLLNVPYLPEASTNPNADDATADDRPKHMQKTTPLPVDQREVTALLVRTVNPFVTPHLSNTINESDKEQAVLPVKEIATSS